VFHPLDIGQLIFNIFATKGVRKVKSHVADQAETATGHYCKSAALPSDGIANAKGERAVWLGKTRCVKPAGWTKQPITHSVHPHNEPTTRTTPSRGDREGNRGWSRAVAAVLDTDKARAATDRKDSRISEATAHVFCRRQLIVQSSFQLSISTFLLSPNFHRIHWSQQCL